MKNIFRIMAAALVASTMLFVACGKEEEEEPIQDEPVVKPTQIVTQFKVKNDSTALLYVDTLHYVDAMYVTDADTFVCKTFATGAFKEDSKGTITMPFIFNKWKVYPSGGSWMAALTNAICYCNKIEEAQAVSTELDKELYFGGFYPEWGLEAFVNNGVYFSDFDATAMSFNYQFRVVLYSLYDYFVDKKTTDYRTADFVVLADNVYFKPQSSSKGLKMIR